MQIRVIHPAFQQQHLVVHAARLVRAPRLQLNGEFVGGKKGCCQVINDAGNSVQVCLKWRFPDPVPRVTIDGAAVDIAHPLAWYVYAWCALPALLLYSGGIFGWSGNVLGGVIGLLGTYLNLRIMRSEEIALLRYWASLLATVGAYLGFALLITVLQAGSGQH
ncbi:MAG TPA: hypothetical protein VFR06_07330 [Gallionellaceae bacterium]|nr:hypothetical protein [Gallionellaceae bacterium]